MSQDKLLIIDGMNVIRRVYESVPTPDSPEKAEGAMGAAHRSLLRALNEHTPSHAVMVLDSQGPTWRHRLYPGYKAHRRPMPEPLAAEIDRYLALPGRALRHILRIEEVEADDMIGSLALQARQSDMDVVVLSTDKDMLTLLPFGVKVYHHFEYRWLDEEWCLKKFGVGSSQLADFLALTGDASDGIPGVAKVGNKTAAKLLQAYGSLEGVLNAASEIKGVVGRNLVEQAELARLSRQLVQLKLDVFDVTLDLSSFAH